MQRHGIAGVVALTAAALCLSAAPALGAVGEFRYVLDSGSTGRLIDPPDGECTAFDGEGVVEATNDTDQVAELHTGCGVDGRAEGATPVASVPPGETYTSAPGDPVVLGVTFVVVRTENTQSDESPRGTPSESPVDALGRSGLAPR